MKEVSTKIVAVLKEFFTKNWGMKLGALAFAFLLWTFVMAETNPLREREFRNIPVSFINLEAMKQKNLTSQIPLQEILSSTNVTVTAEASALQYINEAMITATVDLSKVNDVGTYTLAVDAVCSLGTVAAVRPSEVTFTVEEIVERAVPVEVNVVGDKADWLYYGEPVLSESTITVKGGRTVVEDISKAELNIDITGMELPKKEAMHVTLMDENGDAIDSKQFSGVPSIIVEMPVYPKKSVPVDVDAIKQTITGAMQGYEITEITIEPLNVDIAGKIENINSVSKVELEPITLEQANADTMVNAKVILPEGIVAVVPSEVKVHIKITQPEETRNYPAIDVTVKNLDKALKAELDPEAIDINVYGTVAQFDGFSADKLKPFVDLQGLKAGVHQVPVKFENQADLQVRIVPATQTIEVTIG